MSLGSLLGNYVSILHDALGNAIDSVLDVGGKRRLCVDIPPVTVVVPPGNGSTDNVYSNKLKIFGEESDVVFSTTGTQVYQRNGSGLLYEFHFELDTKDARPEIWVDGVDVLAPPAGRDPLDLDLLNKLRIRTVAEKRIRQTVYAKGDGDRGHVVFEKGMYYSTSIELKMRKTNGSNKKVKSWAVVEEQLT